MRELTISEMEITTGAANWGEVGAGVAAVALAIFIASNPVGLIGLSAATLASYYGGAMIGDGFNNGKILDGDEGLPAT